MKKVLFFASTLLMSGASIFAQQKKDSLSHIQLEEIVVSSTRTSSNSAIAHSNLSEEQIKKENAAKNIPFVLQTLPSVVAYSEDGLGLGNSSFRIRGSDANRINVTLNGMPVNNPESQEVFWVNLPDLSNSLKSLQVQRGVGTSTNGAASFGGSISLQTTGSQPKAYGNASTGIGSYGSFISSISAGTGILKNGLSIDGRYSYNRGDGYIRNGKVNHKSANVTLSHYTDVQMVRLVYINGIQHTGITWEGVSPEKMAENRRYNPAGEYKDDAGNVHYYDNETDNYYSNIVQAIYSRDLRNNLTLNASFSYNSGSGYYENYKAEQKFSKFGLQPQINNGTTYKKSDIIRRKALSNDFYVGMANVSYKKDKLSLSGGGMYSYFTGNHYGQLRWVKYNENIEANHQWFYNDATKRDMNLFAKAEYNAFNNFTVSGELQYRYVDYRMKGTDDDMVDIKKNYYYSFFNPKIGLTYNFLKNNEVYASFGISNREPLRSDLKDHTKSQKDIKSERLYDYELGYRYLNNNFSFETNLYYMDYKNQLVQTGRLSSSGYKLQENVSSSYRMGVELSASYTPLKWLKLDANTTFSKNKIKDYTAFYTTYNSQDDNTGWITQMGDDQISEYKGTTNISFSPNIIGSGVVTVMPIKNLSFSLVNKFIGKMFYDNTSSQDNRLPSYYTANFVVGYTFDTEKLGEIDLQFFVNNIFDKRYVANAWVDINKFKDGSQDIVYKGLFPQAPCNIMARVGIRF